tara:strand:+ start:10264 stop:11391 length:1128 start_codon:yes stop_codon:yes gene_type:complete
MTDENNETSENEVTEIDDGELLDAIEGGISEVSPHLEDNDEETDEPGTDDDAGATEGESEQEGETDQDAADDGTPGDEDADASGSDTDTDEENDDGGAAGEDEQPDDAGGKDGDDNGETPDHINDPIPESTNEKTAERIKGLIDIAKEQTQRADQGQQIIDAITTTGADAEQFNNTLTFLELYNSKDPKQRQQALAVAKGVVHELSIEFGEGSTALLDKYDDLKAEVEEGKLTEARAVEIATTRERDALTTARQESAQASEADKKAANDLMEKGRQQLNDFQKTVEADPAFKALYPTFTKILRTSLRGTHPETWGQKAQELFTELKTNYTPAEEPAADTPPANQPRRAKAGAGNSSKATEPDSALAALDGALEGM